MMKKTKPTIPLTVFDDLKAELRGWNTRSVAQTAGVATSTVYFWLEGKVKTPRLDTVVKVADAIGFELTLRRKGRALRAVA